MIFFTLFFIYPFAQAEITLIEKAPLFLEVGEQRILPLGEFLKYSMSGDAIHYTRLPQSQNLLIKAIKPGQATLIVNRSITENESRTLRIESKKNLAFPHSLYQSLNGLREVEVVQEGEHFLIRGTLREFSEASRVAYLRDYYSKFIIDQTQLEPGWLLDCQNKLEFFLKKYPSLKLTQTEGLLWIQGSLCNKAEVAAVEKAVRAIQPLVQIDIQSLNDHDPTIYFKVFLLEVKKDLLTDFGMGWPSSIPGALQHSPFRMIITNPLELTLNALSQKGAVNILSAPELVVRAPGQAELFAGGELPIRYKTKSTEGVTWKNVGLLLKLDVNSLMGEQVRLNIETSMTHLDSELTNDNVPGIQSNHIKTQADAQLGKPLFLSGLLQEGVRQQIQGFPFLTHIPVLGKLFSSEAYQKNQSELVAILLPHRSTPANPLQRISSDLPRGFLPISRNFLSEEEVAIRKNEKDYPWNVL